MKEQIHRLIVQKKQVILYLLFGVVTTVCSLFACYLTLKFGVLILHDEKGEPTAFLDVLGSTTQWIVGVLVAFVTNKCWVFVEAERGVGATAKQFASFSGARVATYFLEVVLNLAFIYALEGLHYRTAILPMFGQELAISARVWAKALAAIAVVIANYFISKLFVFRRKRSEDELTEAD